MLKEFVRQEDGLAKNERKQYFKKYQEDITALQQKLKDKKLPVIILVEGMALSKKNPLVNEIIKELDPRFAEVFCEEYLTKETLERPFIEPFMNAIPESGKVVVYEGGWVSKAVNDFVKGRINRKQFDADKLISLAFERQLINNGYVVIKMFLNVSSKEQSDTLDMVTEGKSWMDTKKLKKKVKNYDKYFEAYDEFLEATNINPWKVFDSNDFAMLKFDAFKYVYEQLTAAIKKGKYNGKPYKDNAPLVKMPKLSQLDLSAKVEREEYKIELDELGERLKKLQNKAKKLDIPVIACFEGWDAAGKGSAIRRLAYPLDPRLFKVNPIASPEPHELHRHYLWRFWQRLPENGSFAIFDRTWYGRVMVERLEGFCTENDWKRAYAEINEFEYGLTNWGAVIIKFWLQIDKDTQLARFTDRQNTPAKQWKITDEDWRNRDKWDQYELAIDEMIKKTSTEYAPWTIVEANDKPYARLKVLRTVCDRLEEAIERRG